MRSLPDADADAARRLVLQNAPTSEDHTVGSFVDQLFEEASFDAAACQALEAALLALIDAPALAAETDRQAAVATPRQPA